MRPIYKKYCIRNSKRLSYLSRKGYFTFLSKLKRYYSIGVKIISIDGMYDLIRYSCRSIGLDWDLDTKQYYFKYWIKIAVSSGYLKKGYLYYEITPKILEVKTQ